MTENVEKEILEEVMTWLDEEIAPLSKKATMNNTEMAYRRVRARIDKGFADRGIKELPDTYENSRAREGGSVKMPCPLRARFRNSFSSSDMDLIPTWTSGPSSASRLPVHA